jgi:DNA-binding SARP family transcriptional activator
LGQALAHIGDALTLLREIGEGPPAFHRETVARTLRAAAVTLGAAAMEAARSVGTVVSLGEAVEKASALAHTLSLSAPQYTPAMPLLTVRLLGAFEVRRGADRVPPAAWRRRRDRWLFCYLVLAREPVPREVVLEALWPHLPPASARASLNVAWSNVKRVLDPRHGLAGGYLALDRGRYGVRREAVVTDVEVFERQIAAADPAQRAESILAALEVAAATYRGDLLPEAADEPWTVIERERLRGLYVATLRRLADAKAVLGRMVEAETHLREVLRLDPWREDVYRRLMVVLAESGWRSEALRLYRECAAALRRELDVEPDPETTALFEALAAGRPSGRPGS